MSGREVAALLLLTLIGLLAGGIVLWLVLKYLPLIAALILAILVALVLVGVLVTAVGFFAAAVGALYYAVVKRPSTGGRPITLRDAKKLDKEEGKFEEAE
ncbi:MAG: hypothetical protein QI199_02720 [Candidatus Korarchaeota archaeon]|nr:hypothetical protein [Candidatus Korarchaeota archaeon]